MNNGYVGTVNSKQSRCAASYFLLHRVDAWCLTSFYTGWMHGVLLPKTQAACMKSSFGWVHGALLRTLPPCLCINNEDNVHTSYGRARIVLLKDRALTSYLLKDIVWRLTSPNTGWVHDVLKTGWVRDLLHYIKSLLYMRVAILTGVQCHQTALD